MSPARRRDAVAFLVRRHGVSRRRACEVVGQCRSTRRHVAAPGDFEARLVKQMRELSERYPRWGCSVVHALLVEDEWAGGPQTDEAVVVRVERNINRRRIYSLRAVSGPVMRRNTGSVEAIRPSDAATPRATIA